MEFVRFTDQYKGVSRLYGRTEGEQRRRDATQTQPMQRWIALRDGVVVGVATAWLRPDDRLFLMMAHSESEAIGELLSFAGDELARSVSTFASFDDHDVMASLKDAGFEVEMVSEGFRLRFDQVTPLLERAKTPSGISIVSALDADEDRLFELDNLIRRDVPGTDGWEGDRQWFHDELTESPPFDPGGYLVAVRDDGGDYAGLVRAWRNPSGPRLGLVGVLPRYRSTTIAALLLRESLRAAATWGYDTFVTETSLSNSVLHPRMAKYGAESTGRFAQMTRR